MTVVVIPELGRTCMVDKAVRAAERLGRIAGVTVTTRVSSLEELVEEGVGAGEVAVAGAPLDEGVQGNTIPIVTHGAIDAAGVRWRDDADCAERPVFWAKVLEHEFGHAYGLADTVDDSRALMHAHAPSGRSLRDWEIERLQRRLASN